MDSNGFNQNDGYVQLEATSESAYADSYDAQPEGKNGLVIASLICGIASVLCCSSICFGIILGILAIVFAIIGKKKASKKALGTWGLILGIVGLLASIAALIAGGALGIFPVLISSLEYL